VLTVFTPVIIQKHNGMSNFKGNFYPQVNSNNVCDIAIVNLVVGTLYFERVPLLVGRGATLAYVYR